MGRNVLIVEDESIVAMELEEQVKGLACGVIGPASTAAAALRYGYGRIVKNSIL